MDAVNALRNKVNNLQKFTCLYSEVPPRFVLKKKGNVTGLCGVLDKCQCHASFYFI